MRTKHLSSCSLFRERENTNSCYSENNLLKTKTNCKLKDNPQLQDFCDLDIFESI